MGSEFCEIANLEISNTFFPHKNIHKITWNSITKIIKNQIDHFCINKKFGSAVQDVRAFRGADIGSDHNLCIAKLKIKLKKHQNIIFHRKIDTKRLLESDLQEEYNTKITNQYSALNKPSELVNPITSIEMKWENFRNIAINAALDTAGLVQNNKKKWLSENTWSKIQDRKLMKQKILAAKTTQDEEQNRLTYALLDKEVKTSARKDRHTYINNLALEAESASKHNNSRILHHITKQLCNQPLIPNASIKDKNGKVLTTTEQQKQRWAEHFQDLLNRPPPPPNYS